MCFPFLHNEENLLGNHLATSHFSPTLSIEIGSKVSENTLITSVPQLTIQSREVAWTGCHCIIEVLEGHLLARDV